MFDGKYETLKIGNSFKTMSGGTPLKSKKEYYENGTIPWLTSGEVNSGIIYDANNYITELGMNNSSAKLVPVNSVLVAMYGATAGVVGLLKKELTTNQAVCSILPNKDFYPEYIYYSLINKSDELKSRATGGAQPNISQTIIRDTEIYNAPKKEQLKFVEFARLIYKSKFIVQKQIKLLEELLEKKMNEYFGN